MITTTPKPTQLLKSIMSDPHTIITRGSTLDNRSNLPPQFIDALMKRYGEHSRLGRQEIFAKVLEDIEGALLAISTPTESNCTNCRHSAAL
jgi:phage terminase large subunit-like protein